MLHVTLSYIYQQEIAQFTGFAIPHLATVHNLSGRLFHLLQLRHEIPEPGLGDNVVGSKDPHPVERRSPAFRRGQTTPDHLVLPQLQGKTAA